MKSKYKIFLNILFIIFTLAAVGIIGYMSYDYISNYILTKEASKAVEMFEKEVSNVDTNENTENNGPIVVEIGGENENNPNQNQTTTNKPTSSSSKTTYKGYNVIGSIQIPRTNIKYPIVDTMTPNSVAVAVVALYGAGPNQIGNTVFVAHNYRNGTFFSNNKKLKIGDKVYITDSLGRKIEYTIYNTYITADTDFSYATRDTGGKREISLSTCTTDSSKRLVIWAKE